jgi:hypothetical protein
MKPATSTTIYCRRDRGPLHNWILALAFAAGMAQDVRATAPQVSSAEIVNLQPRIRPDYTALIIPPNIAPLNFSIQETGIAFHVEVKGGTGEPIEIRSRNSKVILPEASWRRLLAQNKGGSVQMEIYAQQEDKSWRRFATVTNRVAGENIDPVLIYRKIHAAHSTWSSMGLYQRNLETFEESPILENRRFANDCCHCHNLRNNDPDHATVLIRSSHYQNSMLVISNGTAEALQGSLGFTSWHPQAGIIASSFSKPRLMLHSARNDMRDIAELEGWIGYFPLGSEKARPVPGCSDRTRLFTFPQWSPDGKYLYYCSAPNPWTNMSTVTPTSYKTAKYDLMRIVYDLGRDEWGKPEVVLPVSATGFSITQPRISPDGRWLFFDATEYGCWPTYDPASDLYGIDLVAGERNGRFTCRKLELNSDACESWLSWSSNSRWVVFSSKRISPLYNRPHIAYVSTNGECGKGFILPQKDPEYYDSLLKTYTIPTLAIGPIKVPQRQLVEAIKSTQRRSLVLPPAKTGDASR